MVERCIKGDYIGFTFGGVHSSELGLMRVSDGSRYNQDLLPPLQDKTVQVDGRDGAVYFGSQYNTKSIKVPVAFDNMTEESFNKLKRLLQDKKPKYLWFDETPYKQWLVKSANAQSFKWICFDESQNIARLNDGDSEAIKKRIYKGEGTLEFSCFSPYAESRTIFLDDEVENIIGWSKSDTKRLVWNPFSFSFLEKTNKKTKYNTTLYRVYKNDGSLYGEYEVFYTTDNYNIFNGSGCSIQNIDNSEEQYYKLLFKETSESQKQSIVRFTDNQNNKRYVVLLYKDGKNFFRFTDWNSSPHKTEKIMPLLSASYNYEEWKDTSRLREKTFFIDRNEYEYNVESGSNSNAIMYIYNGGDIDANLEIIIPRSAWNKFTPYLNSTPYLDFTLGASDNSYFTTLSIKPFIIPENEDGIIIDSKLKLIKGYRIVNDKIELTGTNYNKYKKQGDFFKIPTHAKTQYYCITLNASAKDPQDPPVHPWFETKYKFYYI